MASHASLSPSPATTASASIREWHICVLWVAGAALLGFGTSALFSGVLEMSRDWFLVPYFALTAPFLYGYLRWSDVNLWSAIRQRWVWGVSAGTVLGILLIFNILNNEPASPRPEGLALIGKLLWLGVVYGVIDALLLTVVPVSAVWIAFRTVGLTKSLRGKLAAGTIGLGASLVVTAAYHVGYVEFRNAEVVSPLIGNSIMSLGFLVTANPVTAVIAHVALHVVSVLHGVDTTVTLPPHY